MVIMFQVFQKCMYILQLITVKYFIKWYNQVTYKLYSILGIYCINQIYIIKIKYLIDVINTCKYIRFTIKMLYICENYTLFYK